MRESSLEWTFLVRWRQLAPEDAPSPRFQCRFHPEREWVWDFGWINHLIVLDLQGGGYVRGAHNREGGMANDCAKHNAALVMGWRPFLATTSMMENDPQAVIAPILQLLQQPVLSPNAERSMWTARLRNLTHANDTVLENGIHVCRLSGSRYEVTTAKARVKIGGRMKLAEATEQVLTLILSGTMPTVSKRSRARRPVIATLGVV